MKSISVLLSTLLLTLTCSQAMSQQPIEAADFDLADYKGKVVYVDFWASWCTPCRASFPFMAELAMEHGDDLAIIAVNVDEKRKDAEQFLSDFETPFMIVYDSSGKLASEFKVPGMPTSFMFDREGQLVGQHVGFRKKDMVAIREWIATSVAE